MKEKAEKEPEFLKTKYPFIREYRVATQKIDNNRLAKRR
jgi:hypothetical protein